MGIIKFDAGDYLQTKVVEAGIYPTVVSKIEGPKKSTTGKSMSYFVDFTISDGPYKSKTRTVAFNSEMSSASLLGEMQFFPNSYFLLLAEAQGTNDGQPKDTLFDTDDVKDQPFECQWDVATVEGRLINTIGTFYPMGYAKGPTF